MRFTANQQCGIDALLDRLENELEKNGSYIYLIFYPKSDTGVYKTGVCVNGSRIGIFDNFSSLYDALEMLLNFIER